MIRTLTRPWIAAAALTALTTLTAPSARAEPFTYQGQLQDAGAPADGTYDFRFRLFDAPAGGTQIGPTLTFNDVVVTDGVFTVFPNFGDVFNQNNAFIFIEVRDGDSTGGYTGLLPRSPVTAAPKAQHATTADTLDAPAVISSGIDADTLSINLTNPSVSAGSAALRATRGTVDFPSILDGTIARIAEFESADTPIGVLAIADRFGLVGLADQNSLSNAAGILAEVRFGGFSTQAAVWALNNPAGTSAFLARGLYAGEFLGDLRVSGDIIRSYTPSSNDLATPIAYGFINTNGTVADGTPNISSVWNAAQSRYEIVIDDESYFFNRYVTVVTPIDSNITARTSSVSGRLIVDFRTTTTQSLVQSSFQFVTYKPDGAALVRGQQRPPLQPLNTPFTDADLNPHPAASPPRVPVISETTTKSPTQRD